MAETWLRPAAARANARVFFILELWRLFVCYSERGFDDRKKDCRLEQEELDLIWKQVKRMTLNSEERNSFTGYTQRKRKAWRERPKAEPKKEEAHWIIYTSWLLCILVNVGGCRPSRQVGDLCLPHHP